MHEGFLWFYYYDITELCCFSFWILVDDKYDMMSVIPAIKALEEKEGCRVMSVCMCMIGNAALRTIN